MFLQLIYKFTITVDFVALAFGFDQVLWFFFFTLQQQSVELPPSGTKGIQWHSEVEKHKKRKRKNRKRMESRNCIWLVMREIME